MTLALPRHKDGQRGCRIVRTTLDGMRVAPDPPLCARRYNIWEQDRALARRSVATV